MPNFAFVIYTDDNVKRIVPVYEIKDFLPKHSDDFDPKRIYEVFWNNKNADGAYYKAQILKLGDSTTELEDAVKAKRISIHRSSLLKASRSEREHEVSRKNTVFEKCSKKVQHQKYMEKILKRKQDARRKMGPVKCHSQEKKVEGLFDDSMELDNYQQDRSSNLINSVKRDISFGELDPKKLKFKLKETEAILIKCQSDLQEKEQMVEQLKQECKAILYDNDTLSQLNKRLQDQLLSRLENLRKDADTGIRLETSIGKDYQTRSSWGIYDDVMPYTIDRAIDDTVENSQIPSYQKNIEYDQRQTSSLQSTVGPMESPKANIAPHCMVEDNVMTTPKSNTSREQCTPKLGVPAHNMIDIGNGVKIENFKWADISSPSNNSSQFAKKMAVAIWGEEVLAKRTVEGRPPNNKKGQVAWPGLSPEKVNLIKNHVRNRLKDKVADSQILAKEVNAVTKYLNEKIATLRRSTHKSACAKENVQSSPSASADIN